MDNHTDRFFVRSHLRLFFCKSQSANRGRQPKKNMSKRILILALSLLLVSTFVIIPAEAQQDNSASQNNSDNTVEGTVASSSRDTLVVRTDDGQFHLFTYGGGAVRPRSLAQGTRVRVTAGAADENGTR